MRPHEYTKRQLLKIFIGLICVCAPSGARAAVLINEIAWMGDARAENGSYCEWVELWNSGTESVSVTDWVLSFNTTHIRLTGATSIPSGGFFVIERYTENACPDPVSGVSDFSGSFGNGLPNGGATLILTNASGVTVDTVAGSDAWKIGGGDTKGDNASKHTAQRMGSGWGTAAATPGTQNAGQEADIAEEQPVARTTETSPRRGSRVIRGVPYTSVSLREQAAQSVLTLTLNAPKMVYVNQLVSFEVTPEGVGKTILDSLAYTWNFGDTHTASTQHPTHAFSYPGDYVIVVEATFKERTARARHELTVIPASFTLTRGTGGEILIQNQSSHEVDLGGFTLTGSNSFVFPAYTIVKPGSALTVPPHRVTGASVTLFDAAYTAVASLVPPATPRTPPLVALQPVRSAPSAPSEKQSDSMEESLASSSVIYIGPHSVDVEETGVLTRFFQKLRGVFQL